MTLPGADTMNAGISGDESLRLLLGRRAESPMCVLSISSTRDSCELDVEAESLSWPLDGFVRKPLTGAAIRGIKTRFAE